MKVSNTLSCCYGNTDQLLGNILYCEGLLPDDILQQLVLDGLVSRHLLLSLQNSPVDDLTVRKIATVCHMTVM